MSGWLLWLYLINATLLVSHEIDSAYWQEWKLFHLPGGPAGFILLHLPLVFLALWGLLEVARGGTAGLIFSLGLSLSGLAAFGLHAFFLGRGRPEFRTWPSLGLLGATLIVSLLQAGLSLRLLAAPAGG